jgi:F0F1-type ATP synthase membrane subunit b/b'
VALPELAEDLTAPVDHHRGIEALARGIEFVDGRDHDQRELARDTPQTRDRLAAETDKERARVDGLINAKIADAETRIAATKSKALASVNDIAADVAGSLVGKLLGTNPAADEVRKALASVGK